MKWLFGIAAGLCFLAAGGAHAQVTEPDVLIKTVSEEVLEIVRKDKDIQSGNAKKAQDLVEAKVLPHFNFIRMTQLAVGREWRNANPAQQKALTEEFRSLLVRTYSKALTEYRSQTMEYKPLKAAAGAAEVTVRTQIQQPGGKAIQLDYDLERQSQGWKVYDIAVAGVSLVTNYRESFANEIRANGIDGLIKTLQAKNKSGESASIKK
ncbi:MAG: ABC transporter substrate-binding protein [Rhodocyclaceae bacterium]|nr:ABC transporter substrate-binding protein [Rhodocyclaceae bacterium]